MLQGRNEELNTLNDFFERKESNIVVLYGEHLVGTSSLWREFAGGKDTTYLKAVPASGTEKPNSIIRSHPFLNLLFPQSIRISMKKSF